MALSYLILISSLLVASQVSAQSYSDQPIAPVTPSCPTGSAGTIAINGNGKQEALADEAEVALRIAVRNRTADGARQVAGEYATSVITYVRQIPGIYPDNVTTTSVSVSPVTSRADQDGVTTIIGYTFTNSISVKISNVSNDLLSQVLDTAVSRGGNNLTISRVDFSLSDRLSYNITVAARRQAAADARASAQTYADALGVSLGAVLKITDKTYSATPVQQYDSLSRSYAPLAGSSSSTGASTPVSIGSQEVETSISMVFTICNPAS